MLACPPDRLCGEMVRAEGLEPPHLSILEPKSSASTSSATRAAQEAAAYNRRSRLGNPERAGSLVLQENCQCKSRLNRRNHRNHRNHRNRRNRRSHLNRRPRNRAETRTSTCLRRRVLGPSRAVQSRQSVRRASVRPRRPAPHSQAARRPSNATSPRRSGSDRACRRSPLRLPVRASTVRRHRDARSRAGNR